MRTAIICGALALTVTMTEAANIKRAPALESYMRCPLDTAMRLDDSRSDPKTVALGVAAQCAWKRELAIAEMTEGTDDPDAIQGAADGVRRAEMGIIIGMVFEIRKQGMRATRQ